VVGHRKDTAGAAGRYIRTTTNAHSQSGGGAAYSDKTASRIKKTALDYDARAVLPFGGRNQLLDVLRVRLNDDFYLGVKSRRVVLLILSWLA
jgi:hypothetical protein